MSKCSECGNEVDQTKEGYGHRGAPKPCGQYTFEVKAEDGEGNDMSPLRELAEKCREVFEHGTPHGHRVMLGEITKAVLAIEDADGVWLDHNLKKAHEARDSSSRIFFLQESVREAYRQRDKAVLDAAQARKELSMVKHDSKVVWETTRLGADGAKLDTKGPPSDEDLLEYALSGQWRCTVEELQQAVKRLLTRQLAERGCV